jgi:hypothetical protein
VLHRSGVTKLPAGNWWLTTPFPQSTAVFSGAAAQDFAHRHHEICNISLAPFYLWLQQKLYIILWNPIRVLIQISTSPEFCFRHWSLKATFDGWHSNKKVQHCCQQTKLILLTPHPLHIYSYATGYMPCPSHPTWFDQPNNICMRFQIFTDCESDTFLRNVGNHLQEIYSVITPATTIYWAERKVFAFSKRWRKHKLYCHLFKPLWCLSCHYINYASNGYYIID